jgi:hypothetical protein
MTNVAVTLEYGNERIDLALPMNVPSRLLVESLIKPLGLNPRKEKRYFLGVHSEEGFRRIPNNASLGDMTILHGMVLSLLEDDEKKKPTLVAAASLQVENGPAYPLTSSTNLIGRNDPKSGIFVEIDLTPHAPEAKIISRKHAQIDQEGGRFYITDLGSVNGTKVNGQRIPPRERKSLWDGYLIELGKNGVRMTFVSKG